MKKTEATLYIQQLNRAQLAMLGICFAFELTIQARDTYDPGTKGVCDPERLREFNESLHRVVSAVHLCLAGDNLAVPSEMFLAQLPDDEDMTPIGHQILSAFTRSLRLLEQYRERSD
ncbi:hypothetical protein U27_02735 [Candidatus Vecturithrix granuli]|uniref:Uncharacterized protein n=1 Tax=Vecturithrix granuli TaxID=1499967 RepID=A0A081BTX1_VECG1|nr:hypothetical protein U27_02735 [Candidatus Vecturithrix granuli]